MGGNQVPVIGEESSTNGDSRQPRNTRNQVHINKQFQEDPRLRGRGRGGIPGGQMMGARSPNVNQMGRGRGGPGLAKNNFIGGST